MNRRMYLSEFVNSKLRPYQYGIPLIMSAAAGVACALALFVLGAKSDRYLLRDIAPHLSSLIEGQDRTEVARLTKSIAKEREAEIIIVKDNKILVSSEKLDDFDRNFIPDRSILHFAGSNITNQFIISSQEIKRPDGPNTNSSVIIKTPIGPILMGCAIVAVLVLIIGFSLTYLFAHRITLIVQKAIKPIERIDRQIKSLQKIDLTETLALTGISELDAIQNSVIETQRVLADSRDALAVAKAKEMTADAYRSLIHDLHTPVSALQQMIATANTAKDEQDKFLASSAIPKIAEQVVTQIETAKKHLGTDIQKIKVDDIRICVQDSLLQTIEANSRRGEVSVLSKLPENAVIVPHDPDLFRRALSNIIINAIEACKKLVQVTLEEQNNNIIIRVDDDGPGINSTKASEFLLGKGISTKSGRKAYGMAGANHIVRLHHGKIIFKDSILGGACCEVRL